MKATKLFNEFFSSEKSSGMVLMFCAVISLILSNLSFGESYIHFWHSDIFGKPMEFWINDGLMTVFFLLVGLEIEREIYIGELSELKKSMLPIFAALGGMLVPAAIHFGFNSGTEFQSGFGIPMATDIAFSLAILSLLGSRVPVSLKVFLTALAIIDDLGAIIVIALFYSTGFSFVYFGTAVVIFIVMLFLNRKKINAVSIYIVLGIGLWICLYNTGIHPTITGVLLAFAIPFGSGEEKSPSYVLEHRLQKTVAFIILPVFALANTAILLPPSVLNAVSDTNSYGIIFGLVFGKPIGILLFSLIGAAVGLCTIPSDIKRVHIWGAGMLAGIGFTMSIFITLLAFNDENIIVNSKISVLMASVLAGILGFVWLKFVLPNKDAENEE